MTEQERQRVRERMAQSTTSDLLDRITIFRTGMDQEALVLLEREVRARGITPDEIVLHQEKRSQGILWAEPGRAERCWRCDEPAVVKGRRWQKLFHLLPIFPLPAFFCAEHQPQSTRQIKPDGSAG